MVFVPIADHMIDWFDLSRYMVNLAPLVFYVAFPFTVFIANYVNDSVAIKLGMSIGNSLMIIGTGVRLFISNSFYYVLLG